jgi:hypothetical protein
MRRFAAILLFCVSMSLLGTCASILTQNDADAAEQHQDSAVTVATATLQPDPDAVVFLVTNDTEGPVSLLVLADDTLAYLLGVIPPRQRSMFVIPSSSLTQVQTVRGVVQPEGSHGQWRTTPLRRTPGVLGVLVMPLPPPQAPPIQRAVPQ